MSCRGLSQSRGRGSAGVTAVSFLCRLCDYGGLGVAPPGIRPRGTVTMPWSGKRVCAAAITLRISGEVALGYSELIH